MISNSDWPPPFPGSPSVLDASSVLATLLEATPAGILVFDLAGELRVASAPLASMLGVEASRLRELSTFNATVAGLAPLFVGAESMAARWLQHFAKGEASWDDLELASPARKILERYGRPILDSAGHRLGWLEVYRDVTGHRLIENKLFQNERMVALGKLVSSVAHEINNPLTTIYGYAQLLLARHQNYGGANEPQLIMQEAERATRLARSLLHFARGAKIERGAVDLNEIVRRTMALRTYELSAAGIRVHMNLADNLPAALADATQLQQVVLNLVTNAEQAVESKGQGRIWLLTRRVSHERLALDVTDDGTGIAPEVIAQVFDPFFTTKPPGLGTGIGLSIVRGIVHEHGGEVYVQSHPGQGAMFTVELLVAGASEIEHPAEPAAPRYRPATSPFAAAARTQRILVIEDEPTIARLIADVLTEEGYSVEPVLDSRQGLDLLRHHSYDLLVCDFRMPYLDGPALYRELLRMNCPLARCMVFVTGDMLLPRTVEFLETSGVPCLPKPFLVEELKEIVRTTLSRDFARATAEAGKEAV